MREYYDYWERSLPQYDTNISEYSSHLGYVLRTNTSTFANREFSTTIRPNSMRLRDDEQSLVSPEIVTIGDSYTFGWGCESRQTYSEVLERAARKRVLSIGVPSYGTAREMILMSLNDVRSARHVIIQYIHNDYAENVAFLAHTNALPIMSQDRYLALVQSDHAAKRYWPGKHTRYLLPKIVGYARRGTTIGVVTSDYVPPPVNEEVQAFVKVLLAHSSLLEGKQLIVFSINDWNLNNSAFVTELASYLRDNRERFPDSIANITAFDASEVISASDYFILDHHIDADGHRKLGLHLAELIQSADSNRPPLDPAEQQEESSTDRK